MKFINTKTLESLNQQQMKNTHMLCYAYIVNTTKQIRKHTYAYITKT